MAEKKIATLTQLWHNRKRVTEIAAKPGLPIHFFASPAEWGAWLAENHATSNGVWLKFFKKASGLKSISYAEALDEALCHGWIDGQRKPFDATAYLVKFTPRRPKSLWSKINQGHVARLHKLKKMKPAGLAVIEAAKRDGAGRPPMIRRARPRSQMIFSISLAKIRKQRLFLKP